MGWKPEVKTNNIEDWAGNALVFETEREAKEYVHDLMYRWTSVIDTRAREVEDKPNYKWENNTLVRIT